MQNVCAYCRVSTDKTDQLNSFDAQKEFFLEYAQKNNLNLVNIYADEGISGTKIKNRTAFKQMMKDSEQGKFQLVLVKDISRFARNTVDLLQSTRKLKSLGIELRFITSNMNILGESEFVLTIFGALAQEESANTSKRIKFGKKINAQKGRVPNCTYGYNKIKGDLFNLEINEKESEIVKRIFRMYVEEGYGQSKISQILNEEKIYALRAKWSQVAVSRILKNPIYKGVVINHKEYVSDFLTGEREKINKEDWYITENKSLQIIDTETFDKAQEILAERLKKNNYVFSRRSNRHLFSTLIKCSECGYSYTRFQREYKTTTTITWECSGRNKYGTKSCSNRFKIKEEDMIQYLNDYFISITKDKENFIQSILTSYKKKFMEQKEQCSVTSLEIEKEKLRKKKQKQIELFENDIIEINELKQNTNEINKRLYEIDFILKSQQEIKSIKIIEKEIRNIVEEISNVTDVKEMTNAQLKKYIDKIISYPDKKIEIVFHQIN